MDTLKIRVKIGDHEFEAEGPRESIEQQFQMFKELVGAIPATDKVPTPKPQSIKKLEVSVGDSLRDDPPDEPEYSELFSSDGDRLSLHYLPDGDDREFNALLLLLLGYRTINGQEMVLGGRLMQGLQQSGLTLDRIDRIMEPHIGGLVLKTGIRRGTKYRLSNLGFTRAKEVANRQLEILG